jgi:hypothetical protein
MLKRIAKLLGFGNKPSESEPELRKVEWPNTDHPYADSSDFVRTIGPEEEAQLHRQVNAFLKQDPETL